MRLHLHLFEQLQASPALLNLFTNIELPLLSVLSDMERGGVEIDAKLLAEQSSEIAERLLALEEAAYKEAGKPFNLGSPKQLQSILFDELQLPVFKENAKRRTFDR